MDEKGWDEGPEAEEHMCAAHIRNMKSLEYMGGGDDVD